MRDVVILDAQWVIDAVTSFVRDFRRADHTTGYERMRSLDKRARDQLGEAWALLTGGEALLSLELLDLLWEQEEFAAYKEMLRKLTADFGLIIPVPNRPNTWLVPALLSDGMEASSGAPQDLPDAPRGWPSRSPDSLSLRVFFHLKGLGPPEGCVGYGEEQLKEGFLPIVSRAGPEYAPLPPAKSSRVGPEYAPLPPAKSSRVGSEAAPASFGWHAGCAAASPSLQSSRRPLLGAWQLRPLRRLRPLLSRIGPVCSWQIVFHRICAGALGCSYFNDPGTELTLQYSIGYVALGAALLSRALSLLTEAPVASDPRSSFVSSFVRSPACIDLFTHPPS